MYSLTAATHDRVLLTNGLTRYYLAQLRASINLYDNFQQRCYHFSSCPLKPVKDGTAEMLLAHPIHIPILLPAYSMSSRPFYFPSNLPCGFMGTPYTSWSAQRFLHLHTSCEGTWWQFCR